MATQKWISPLAGLGLLFFGLTAGAAGLRGEYGYLTAFHCQSDAEARVRIRTMARDFGIREFQLYDWFADYSTPLRGARWTDPFFHKREICRQTLATYVDEIHRQGGRAWAYVQAVGAEETSWANPAKQIFPLLHNGVWHRHAGRFPCYFLNPAWAQHMVKVWAPAVRELGFDGIHWDTLGALAPNYPAEASGVHAFLKTAQKELRPYGLSQTMNFVDMAWFDPNVVLNRVEFPYVEVWSTAKEQAYYQAMNLTALARRRGVLGFYPSAAAPPGWSSARIIIARHGEAARHRLSYVAVADGDRRVVNEYWPNTVPISPEERRVLAQPGVVAAASVPPPSPAPKAQPAPKHRKSHHRR
jgi:hypothetical protein